VKLQAQGRGILGNIQEGFFTVASVQIEIEIIQVFSIANFDTQLQKGSGSDLADSTESNWSFSQTDPDRSW